jgi:6-phosphogluconolactonase (cycloisomerase 2 family)
VPSTTASSSCSQGNFKHPHVIDGGAKADDCAAHIALSPHGRHAYVGVRGSNRISVLAVDGTSGQFSPLAECPSGGDWPRHHLVREGWLHVAHERSHEVTTFRLDAKSGLPGQVHDRLSTGSPTALIEALSYPRRVGPSD